MFYSRPNAPLYFIFHHDVLNAYNYFVFIVPFIEMRQSIIREVRLRKATYNHLLSAFYLPFPWSLSAFLRNSSGFILNLRTNSP